MLSEFWSAGFSKSGSLVNVGVMVLLLLVVGVVGASNCAESSLPVLGQVWLVAVSEVSRHAMALLGFPVPHVLVPCMAADQLMVMSSPAVGPS